MNEKHHILIQAESVPSRKVSPHHKILEDFKNSEHPISYIQLDNLEELKTLDSILKGIVRRRRKSDIKVIIRSKTLRIYLEKIVI